MCKLLFYEINITTTTSSIWSTSHQYLEHIDGGLPHDRDAIDLQQLVIDVYQAGPVRRPSVKDTRDEDHLGFIVLLYGGALEHTITNITTIDIGYRLLVVTIGYRHHQQSPIDLEEIFKMQSSEFKKSLFIGNNQNN